MLYPTLHVMKNILYPALILSCIIFCCCVEKEARTADLERIDNIADINPRHALAMLDSIRPLLTERNENYRNHYALLRLKAEDKAFIPHKTDTLILRLVRYYESTGDKRLLPVAYYYAGRIYSDMNDDARALQYYQKAVSHTSQTDSLRYKTYHHIAYLFLYQKLYDKSHDMFTRSYNYFKSAGDKTFQAYNLFGIAYCLQRTGRENQAVAYFRKALALAHETGDQPLATDLTSQIANHYYRIKDYAKAKKYIRLALPGTDSINASAMYRIAANIYEKTGRTDSAVIYNKLTYATDDIDAKHDASRWLAHHYLKHRDFDKALRYMDEYENYSDSMQKVINTETVARIDAIYSYNQREKENMQLRQRLMKGKYSVYVACSVAVAAILLLGLVVLYMKKKRQAERIRFKNENTFLRHAFEQSMNFIEENNRKISELNFTIANTTSKNIKLVSELKASKTQLENLNKIAQIKLDNKKLAEAGLEHSDICTKIFAILNDKTMPDSSKKLPREYWQLLDKEVNSYFPQLKNSLTSLCRISEHEYRVCLLLKIGVRPKDIALLTNKSKNAISSTRKRLYFKAFGKDAEPEQWDIFIRSL